jgi:hypothetical protein
MSDREFENYLTLIGRLLRLSSAQRAAIGEELRDHFESRLAELMDRGFSHEQAVQLALEEFGDAAGLAAQFSNITQTRKRKIIMRCTLASVVGLAATVLVALAVWPDNHAPKMIDSAAAQSSPDKPQTSAAPPSEKHQERHLFLMQNMFSPNLATTLTKAYPSGDGSGVLVVAEPTSNSLLVSAPPETMKEIASLIAEIDCPHSSIAVDVWFVNLQPETLTRGDNRALPSSLDFLPAGRRAAVLDQLHQLEKEGKAVVTNHFRLTCLDNQPAFAEQGERRPGNASTTTTTNPNGTQTSTRQEKKIGTTVQVQARISSGNEITMSVDAEKSAAAPEAKDGAVGTAAKAAQRSEQPGPTNVAILGQSTIHIANGDIANVAGVESVPDDGAGSYQILVSAEVLPQGAAAK